MHFFVSSQCNIPHTMNPTPRYTIEHIPLLRLLIPMVVGIVWQHLFPQPYTIVIPLTIATICGIMAWRERKETFSLAFHTNFSISLFAIILCMGMIIYTLHQPDETLPDIEPGTTAIARIESPPADQTHSYRTTAVIVALSNNDTTTSTHIPLSLDIQHSYTAQKLQGGDIIIFTPRLERIRSSSIPHSFDYALYMKNKGILFRQYLPDGAWTLSSYYTPPTLKQQARQIQSACIDNLRNSGLSPDHIAILSTLIWGYKADLPDSIRDYFSAAGLSHVLAVSGLHMGIIILISTWLLTPLRYTRLRKLSYIITIATLWVYAFVTGQSPSVMRACIMATFVGIASIINRRNTSLNALCGSAIIILLLNPMQLFDIGFQLSYTAVAGILLFTSYLDIARLTEQKNPILRYLSGSIAVSVSAQIITLPIAAYYFHYIPLWGLLSNIILVPLLPIIVVSTLVLQLCTACNIPHAWLTDITDFLTGTLMQGADIIANLPGAVIDKIWLSPHFILLYTIIVIATWYALSRHTLRPLTLLLFTLILIQMLSLYDTTKSSTAQAFIAPEYRHTHLQLADNAHNCYIISSDSAKAPPRQGEEWRINQHLNTHVVNHNDTIRTPHIYIALPFIQYYNRRLLWIDDNTWRYTHTSEKIHAHYAVITEQYNGSIASLLQTFQIDTVILPASLFPERATRLQQECNKKNIDCHNIREDDIWNFVDVPTSNKSHY